MITAFSGGWELIKSDGNQKVVSAPVLGASGPCQHVDPRQRPQPCTGHQAEGSFGHTEPSFRGVDMSYRKVPVPCMRETDLSAGG